MGFLSKLTGSKYAKQAQAVAEREQEEAEKRNVTVQLGAVNPMLLQADQDKLNEETAQNARKRRTSLNTTLRSGLVGGGVRRTLG